MLGVVVVVGELVVDFGFLLIFVRVVNSCGNDGISMIVDIGALLLLLLLLLLPLVVVVPLVVGRVILLA